MVMAGLLVLSTLKLQPLMQADRGPNQIHIWRSGQSTLLLWEVLMAKSNSGLDDADVLISGMSN